ncbi:MAG TPA: NUDIX domain-containing protein, partial [Candidatus Saccharimonadales bacterium]|nr:NUDIX domain-containing protein [Candidatus Saccharimonadales bacterium]
MIKKDELLFTVDENNLLQEPKPRNEVHANGYWHRTAHIWIFNDKKEILCQKRSLLKDMNPGKWEPFFGGHMAPQEEYIDNALLEL